MTSIEKLTTKQMASFAANGFIELQAVVPDDLNARFLEAMHSSDREERVTPEELERLARLFADSDLPAVKAGTPILDAYPQGSVLGDIVRLPRVRGTIESLVGPGSLVDHHFVHILNGSEIVKATRGRQFAQHLHQDSTIDPRMAFDTQLFYFPHEVTPDAGGTRFIPGSHLRIVNESAIARYQNVLGQRHIVCPAGTIFFMHHGIWHGGGVNYTNLTRFLYKLRLNPTVRQQKLWDTTDMNVGETNQRPIFFVKKRHDSESVASILTRPLPWFEMDTGRIEYIQRIKFWRFLSDDDSFDADYWVSRLECSPEALHETSES